MKDFKVQFAEVHWDKTEERTKGGGTKVEYFVQELEQAKRDCKPVVLVLYSRTEGQDMTAEEWNLISKFFEAETELSALANDGSFALYGMNRACGCWKDAPMRADRPMIILFDHKGNVAQRITSDKYPFEKLVKELKGLQQKAIRDCGNRGSAGGVQGTGDDED